ENRPIYNVSLYLEELHKSFDAAYGQELARSRKELKARAEAREKELQRKLKKDERKQFVVSSKDKAFLQQRARYEVASNVAAQVSMLVRLPSPVFLNPTNFERHYQESRALPYPIVTNLSPAQIAL